MESLVELPLHHQVSLLSYALLSYDDDLAQQALDALSATCRDLRFKISAEKSRAMAVKLRNPEAYLCIQGTCLPWTGAYNYLGVWIN